MSLEFLTAQGWQAKRHTLTTFQTYLWGTLFALPFILLAGGMYRMFLFDRAVLLDHTGLILLGVAGILQPTTSALLHNTSTLLIGMNSMKNLVGTEEI